MSKYILISHLSCDDLLQLGVGGVRGGGGTSGDI